MSLIGVIGSAARRRGGGVPAFGGASRLFDGTDDSIDFTFPTLTAANAFSVAFWIKANTIVANDIVLGRNANGHMTLFFGDTTLIRFSVVGVTTGVALTISTGAWVHYVWSVASASSRKIYENGAEVSSQTSTVTFANQSGTAHRLGTRSAGGAFFDGRLADFRIYDRAITAGEASDLADGIHVDSDLLQWMLLDSDDVLDWSGVGNNGTNNGSVHDTDGPLD